MTSFCEVGRPTAELRLPDMIDIPETLTQVAARYDGKVLGPPRNRPGLRLT